jgi:hypothetical protein
MRTDPALVSGSEPIMVPCEGGGCPTHPSGLAGFGVCSMCGELVPTIASRTARPHERVDVLAMIDRGDFG